MGSNPTGVRVQCPACGWHGHRVYVLLDDLSSKPAGLGTCPKCPTPTPVVRILRRIHVASR